MYIIWENCAKTLNSHQVNFPFERCARAIISLCVTATRFLTLNIFIFVLLRSLFCLLLLWLLSHSNIRILFLWWWYFFLSLLFFFFRFSFVFLNYGVISTKILCMRSFALALCLTIRKIALHTHIRVHTRSILIWSRVSLPRVRLLSTLWCE